MKSLVLAILAYSMLLSSCSQAAKTSQDAIYRGDLQRTGVYDVQPVKQLNGVLWKFQTGGEVWSSPVEAGGLVFFGSDDNFFYAVDARTGQEKWRFETGDDVRSSPTVVGGIVYFRSFDQYIYALKATNGELAWKVSLKEFEDENLAVREQYDDFLSSPLVANGLVYTGNYVNLYALDASTGQEKWRLKVLSAQRSIPTLANGILYFGAFDNLYAMDAQTGQEKWKFKCMSVPYAPAVKDGILYFASKDTYLYALDALSGELKWKNNLSGGSWVTSSPAVWEGMVYAGTSDGRALFAVHLENGETAWQFPSHGYVWGSPSLAGGVVYFGSGNKNFYAMDAKSGQELWHFETGGPVYSTPWIAEGVVYFGSNDGFVYALH